MKNRQLAVLAIGGLLLWVSGAAIDTLVSGESFLDCLMAKVPASEFYVRVASVAVLTLLALIIDWSSSMSKPTELESLRDSQQTYRNILDDLPVGVYRMTPDGRIHEANRKLAEILGHRDVADLHEINLNDFFVNKSDRKGHLEKLRDSTVFAEFELRRKDGRTVWIRDYPKAVMNPDGTIAFLDGVFVETHGIDAIMREIQEHRRLESMKDRFISSVTHELRTPLVSIKGYVDYILARESGSLPYHVKSNIEIVRRNTDRLLKLTDDLLNVQRMESGRVDVKNEAISIREMITQCVEEIRPLLEEKDQKIRVDLAPGSLVVEGDHLRLSEVLMNLLYNSTKFTPRGGKIMISAREEEGAITVFVTDTGIGIDKNDLERIFEPFAVIEKPTYFKGTGLGLSLARSLIEAQGGKIWASSPGKGRGATFAFTLPKQKAWIEIHG